MRVQTSKSHLRSQKRGTSRTHKKCIQNVYIRILSDILLMNSTCIQFRWQRALHLAIHLKSIVSMRVRRAHYYWLHIDDNLLKNHKYHNHGQHEEDFFYDAAPNRNRRNSSFLSFFISLVFVRSFWIRWPLHWNGGQSWSRQSHQLIQRKTYIKCTLSTFGWQIKWKEERLRTRKFSVKLSKYWGDILIVRCIRRDLINKWRVFVRIRALSSSKDIFLLHEWLHVRCDFRSFRSRIQMCAAWPD